jgi:hypothetical protein
MVQIAAAAGWYNNINEAVMNCCCENGKVTNCSGKAGNLKGRKVRNRKGLALYQDRTRPLRSLVFTLHSLRLNCQNLQGTMSIGIYPQRSSRKAENSKIAFL